MFKIFSLSILLLALLSCATRKEPSPAVKNFVQDWSETFEQNNPEYNEMYESYLSTVEEIYISNGYQNQFKSYLDSIVNNSQLLAHKEYTLPQIYRKEKRRRRLEPYKLYKTREMTSLYDKLFNEREMRIKQDLGTEMYQKLKDNYTKFMDEEDARKFAFPL